MSKTNCVSCGRDTSSMTKLCNQCNPKARFKGNSRIGVKDRSQLSAKAHFLDRGEVPMYDPIDPRADKDKEWDEFDFD